jgi:hypothetical protein
VAGGGVLARAAGRRSNEAAGVLARLTSYVSERVPMFIVESTSAKAAKKMNGDRVSAHWLFWRASNHAHLRQTVSRAFARFSNPRLPSRAAQVDRHLPSLTVYTRGCGSSHPETRLASGFSAASRALPHQIGFDALGLVVPVSGYAASPRWLFPVKAVGITWKRLRLRSTREETS